MKILVKDIEHLKVLASNANGDFVDFYISLSGGLAKSSKRILFFHDIKAFSIINEIDESYQEVHISELSKKTLLIQAIDNKCLFKIEN